jgi:hypothetical protein
MTTQQPHDLSGREFIEGDSQLFMLKSLHQEMTELRKELKSIDVSFKYHHATYIENTEKAIHKAIEKGFPNADLEGHRKMHESAIRRAEETADFWHDMRKELGKWGLISLFGWLIYAAWTEFLKGPK